MLIIGFGVGVYLWLNTNEQKSSDAIQAIPADASVIIRADNIIKLNESLQQSRVWESISGAKGFNPIVDVLSYIDSISKANAIVHRLVSSNPVYVALCLEGANRISFFFSVKIPEEVNPSDLYSFAKLQAVGLFQDEEKYYNQAEILSLKKTDNSRDVITVTCHKGIVSVSNSVLLVEKSIAQLDNGISLANNPQFIAINKTSGSRVDANIFINPKYLPSLIKPLMNDSYRSATSTLADIAQWIELDLNLSSNGLVMSGLSTVADSTNSFLRILTRQKPVDIEIPSVLPVETGLLVWMGISNLDEYLEGYRSYLDRKREIFSYTQGLSGYRKFIGGEIQEYFKNIIDEEIGLAFLPSNKSDVDDSWYIVAKTKSASNTNQYLQNVIANYRSETHVDFPSKPIAIKLDKEKTIEIYRFPLKGLHGLLLGSLFSSISDEYYCFVDNWIIWGESPESLERYVKANIRNNVLMNDNAYKQFSEELPKKANYYIYVNPSVIDRVAKVFLSAGNNAVTTPYADIQGISYQLIGGSNLVFNTLTVTSGAKVQSNETKGIWETKLESTPTTKPQIVINHTSKEKEIFVQDSENNIYLINSIGRILWTKKVDGPILGEIAQVDLYKNRKLQYAFNTSSKLYIIDRNGKDVSGFPVLYPATATNPVSAIDYDNSRDYRFFQACSDRKIYIYDSKGKLVKGWRFDKTETIVTDRIGFVRLSGLDYLVVFDSNRPYLLNRRGEERVKLKQFFSKAPNSTFSLGSDSRGKSYIVTTDTIGLVRYLYLDGKVDDITLQTFSKWHSFIYEDLNGDGKKDYIFLDNKTLYAFNSSKDPLFQLKIKDEIKPTIMFFDFGGDNKIGVVSEKSNKIYLVNNKGKLEDSFPYAGSTPFSISKITTKVNSMSLIVGSEQGTVINYGLK